MSLEERGEDLGKGRVATEAEAGRRRRLEWCAMSPQALDEAGRTLPWSLHSEALQLLDLTASRTEGSALLWLKLPTVPTVPFVILAPGH